MNHSRYLDGMRGLAALSIVVLHTWLYADQDKTGGAFEFTIHELRLGLICFFVLSGFLLYRSWLSDKKPNTKKYFKKRLYRILPAYYVAMIGAFIIMAIFAPERLPDVIYWPAFLIFGQNFFNETIATVNPPTWTLALEMSFYLILPLLGLAAIRLGKKLTIQMSIPFILIVFGIGFNYFFASQGDMPRVIAFSLPTMIYYFACGMACAVAAHYWRAKVTPSVYLVLGVSMLALNILMNLAGSTILNETFRDLPAAIGFALIILSLPQKESTSSVWRSLGFLGLVSYGIYLWHMPLLIALSNANLLPASWLLALLIVVPISVALGTLSWFLVEKPFILRSSARPKQPKASSVVNKTQKNGSASADTQTVLSLNNNF
jgi:peptidoglycan/LPS O-acetylase OafA/YrhL